ncbi:hypothetical protein ACI8AC_16800 [Geodermatophilus sp. SYSU D00758]
MQAIDRADLPVAIEGDGVEFRTDRFDDMSIAWVRLPAGADLRPALAGLPGDLCPCPHWGYVIRGRLVMHGKDGSTAYEAGQAFYWAPGHAPEAVTDCEYVDVSPSQQLGEVVRHLQGG